MNQSSYIAAFLLAAFVLYLAAQNRLAAYATVLWGSPNSSSDESSSVGNGSSTGIASSGNTEGLGTNTTSGTSLFPQAYPDGTWTVTPKGPAATGQSYQVSPSDAISGAENAVSSATSLGTTVGTALTFLGGFFGL